MSMPDAYSDTVVAWPCAMEWHYNDVIMRAWRLKSPASRLFTQPFIQTQIKENIIAPRHWPLCEEFTGTGEFPAQRTSNAENISFDDDIMKEWLAKRWLLYFGHAGETTMKWNTSVASVKQVSYSGM